MSHRLHRTSATSLILGTAVLSVAIGALGAFNVSARAQGRGQGGGSPQTIAPIDLTGYWVSLVTEDWRFRMVTPPKGDYASVPLNAEGRRVADNWDPAKDTADGNACKSYGAAAIMRVPGRLHITWQDSSTLKIETDAGEQTRLLHFDQARPSDAADWQGYSVAAWEVARGGGGGFAQNPVTQAARGEGRAVRAPQFGDLRVETSQLKAGYLRKNGVPYSENTVVTEYFDHHTAFGIEFLTVTTIVHDPKYLAQDFYTSTDFKKEADGSKWHPAPCTAN